MHATIVMIGHKNKLTWNGSEGQHKFKTQIEGRYLLEDAVYQYNEAREAVERNPRGPCLQAESNQMGMALSSKAAAPT